MESTIKIGSRVSFPANNGERIYMLPFFQNNGLPLHLSRWQSTVDQMLKGIHTDDPIYLMIDQGMVSKGQTLRRPGLHVEGNWDEGIRSHRSPRHIHEAYDTEMVILASDIIGCRALVGDFDGRPGSEGQCDHIDTHNLEEVILAPFITYKGTVTTLHESLPMLEQTERTLVRLNLPGVTLQ